MKIPALLTLLLLIASCKQPSTYDFLLGRWERSNEEAGKQTFETWIKQNDTTYIGHGYTLRGTDTVWQENMVFSPIAGVWYYQVMMPGETQSTNFKVTTSQEQAFICENPQNDFPKSIQYQKIGKALHAEISGGGPVVQFLFKPIE